MGYSIGLYKVPDKFKAEEVDTELMYDLVFSPEYSLEEIEYAGLSYGSEYAVDLANTLGIMLTNDSYFTLFTEEDLTKAEKEYANLQVENRYIDYFLKAIKEELRQGSTIFLASY